MNILIDMNLSPLWVEVFERHGIRAVHWSTVGDPWAIDQALINWAYANRYIVFTHDLDFGMILALTKADGPSVIQIRTQDVLPSSLERIVMAAIEQYQTLLESGALIIVDESTSRARVLPLSKR